MVELESDDGVGDLADDPVEEPRQQLEGREQRAGAAAVALLLEADGLEWRGLHSVGFITDNWDIVWTCLR